MLARMSQTNSIVKISQGIHVHDESSVVHDATVKMPVF